MSLDLPLLSFAVQSFSGVLHCVTQVFDYLPEHMECHVGAATEPLTGRGVPADQAERQDAIRRSTESCWPVRRTAQQC